MTDIEAKALALVNEVEREEGEKELTRRIMRGLIMDEALCRAIEQHEAFRQEVSDVVYHYIYVDGGPLDWQILESFIIPNPKPDPLVGAVAESDEDFDPDWDYAPYAERLRAALEARGLEIREKGQ